MKKFLKSRTDFNETSSSQSTSPPADVALKAQTVEAKPVFQPPLPTYPPPPDTPPNIKIKTEKEDDIQDTPEEGDLQVPVQSASESEKPDKNSSKKTMCKEWVRGNCKRAVCKYSHELDISQLRGVYTFCWNYQNDRCTYPYCKYVHATIFEEAEFYRTGILPPQAKSHLKKPGSMPPPTEDTQGNMQASFVGPPLLQGGVEKMPVITCVPPSVLEQRPGDGFANDIPGNKSPHKREWTEIEDFGTSPLDIDSNEHLAKKCKNCGILEFRLQYNKEKVDNVIQEKEETTKKLQNLNKKCNKLTLVLQTLFNSMNKGNFNGGDKNILEQFINSNKSPSVLDDNAKTVFGANLSNLMAKILCVASDQTLSPESRET